jgi:hypothetical protein
MCRFLVPDLIDAAGFVRRRDLEEDESVGFCIRYSTLVLLIDIYLDDSHR